MAKRMILMLLAIFAVVGLLAWLKVMQVKKAMAMGAAFAPPPAAVSTVVVQPEEWQPTLRAVGTLKAVHGVTVSTDMAGIVSEISFESGRNVKKGDVLVKMDTEQEEAQIRAAEARLDLAKTDLSRKKNLLQTKAIANADYDTAESELRKATASVEEMKAMTARKCILAPFDGVIGIRQVNLGQYLNPGAAIAPLQSLDPIYADFALPQQNLGKVEIGRKIRVNAAGWPAPVEGEITAIDAQVDENTRNITVEGTLKNADHRLRPGMYIDVEVIMPEQEKVLAIPSSAVSFAPYGDSVYVVLDGKGPKGEPQKVVEQRFVKLGRPVGDRIAVESGLKPGDEIVTNGVFRLRPGAAVNVNNSVQPENELHPKPADT
jgi:membrane fusion protein (multidrug efflux system)